jgi:hypothetical protein
MLQNPEMHFQRLLAINFKSAQLIAWNSEERTLVAHCLAEKGDLSVVAASILLASGSEAQRNKALRIVSEFLRKSDPPRHVEQLIYEGLIPIRPQLTEHFKDDLFRFIKRSLSRRRIVLTNVICLLGIHAKYGEKKAVDILNELTQDTDNKVAEHASEVLSRIRIK